MSGPPARDQKFAPSQLVGLPPDVTRAVFLRTQLLLMPPAACRLPPGAVAGHLANHFLAIAVHELYRFSLGRVYAGTHPGTRPGRVQDASRTCAVCLTGSREARKGNRMRRPTIADIAQRAGVTKAAVSFALNGQPGVSAATRERILAIAREIG